MPLKLLREDYAGRRKHIVVRITHRDLSLKRRLEGVRLATTERNTPDIQKVAGRTYAPFDLRAFITGATAASDGVDMINLYRSYQTELGTSVEKQLDTVSWALAELPIICKLNNLQKSFYISVLNGPKAAIAIFEGCAASGKTHTLACLAVVHLIMGFRVLQTAQSEESVDGVFHTTVTLINAHDKLRYLLLLVLWLYSSPKEREYSRLISNTLGSGETKGIPPHCLARHITNYAAKNADDKTVVEYTDYYNSYHNDHGGSNEDIHERIGGLALRGAFLVATTFCAAQSLGSTGW